MKLITLYLPETYIKELNQLVAERFFPNRAEAIRASVRDLLVEFGRFQAKSDYKASEKNVLAAVERAAELQERHAPRRFKEAS